MRRLGVRRPGLVVDQLPPRDHPEDGEYRPFDGIEVTEQIAAQGPVHLPPAGQEAPRDDGDQQKVQHEGPAGQPPVVHGPSLTTSGPALYQAALTAARSLVRESLASPKRRMVLGPKRSALSTPEKPGRMLRFRNTTLAALSTSRMGMPYMGLSGLSRAAGLTTSLAPTARAPSVLANSSLSWSISFRSS